MCPQTRSNQTEPLLGPGSPETFIPYTVWVISSWNTVYLILCPPGKHVLEKMSCHFILFYFFLGGAVLVLGLCCCAQVFSSCSRWGLLSSCAAGASCYSTCSYCGAHPGRAGFARGSMRVQRLCHTGLVGCPAACGIFPDQGLNLCSLHWQADSYPLDHQGSSSSSD